MSLAETFSAAAIRRTASLVFKSTFCTSAKTWSPSPLASYSGSSCTKKSAASLLIVPPTPGSSGVA